MASRTGLSSVVSRAVDMGLKLTLDPLSSRWRFAKSQNVIIVDEVSSTFTILLVLASTLTSLPLAVRADP